MASMSLSTTLPSRHRTSVPRPNRSAEAIVVGAGLSGLRAAYDLQQAGVSCLVLEAQDRLGGRFSSKPCAAGRGTADFGGAWIDVLRQPRAAALVRDLGIEMVPDNTQGQSVMQAVAGFTDVDQRSYARVRDNLERLSHRVDLNNPTAMLPNYGSMSVHELVRSQAATPAVLALAETWTSLLFGLAARDVSALYFLLCCKTVGGFLDAIGDAPRGSRRVRFRYGVDELARGLAERLLPGSVVLAQAVQWIDQTSGNKVVVTTAEGEVFQCSKVIVATPTAAYKNIAFSPSLGEPKEWLQSAEQPGFYAEAVLVFDHPWWREQGFNGFSQSVDGPVWETRDTSCDADGVYSLTCVIAGESGRAMHKVCFCQRRQRLLNHLGSLFGDVPKPSEVLESNWAADDLSQHVPCPAIPTKYLETIAQDQWMPEDNIHFVGSEASHVWRGHIEGALASGSRGAEEVLAELRPVAEELLAARL